LLDPFVVLLDARAQLCGLLEQRLDGFAQRSGQILRQAPIDVSGVACRSRSPNDFVSPRRVDQPRTRSTSAARARIIARSACAASHDAGSEQHLRMTRANRATSPRPAVLLVAGSAISRVRAIGHDHLMAIAFRCRLTHGECVPTSNARRLGRSPEDAAQILLSGRYRAGRDDLALLVQMQ